MPNIDTFLFIGDDFLNGAQSNTGSGEVAPSTFQASGTANVQRRNLWTAGYNSAVLNQYTPANADGSASAAYLPFYDGSYQKKFTTQSGSGGTVTYGATTMTDTAKTWTASAYVNYTITAGSETHTISANNTSGQVTLAGSGWSSTPSSGTAYTIDGVASGSGATVTYGANTMTDTTKAWAANALVGCIIESGSERRRVTANTTGGQVTVNANWGTTPSSGAAYNVRGEFVTYHHTPPLADGGVGLANGSAWYGNRNDWGSDISLMPLLGKLYPTSPGFRFFKYAQAGGFSSSVGPNSWHSTGSGFSTFQTFWQAAKARALTESSPATLVPKCVWVAIGALDIAAPSATFEADVRAFITAIRSEVAADVPIVFLNHSPQLYNYSTTAGLAAKARQLLIKIRGDTSNVGLWDAAGDEMAAFGLGSTSTNNAGNDGLDAYTAQATIRWGAAMLSAYQGLTANQTPTVGTGLRTYVFLGSSQTVGSLLGTHAILGEQPTLIGSGNTNTPPWTTPNAKIWTGSQLENYDISSNANTIGTVAADVYGAELTFYAEQTKAHPGETIALLKVSQNGAALVSEASATATFEKPAAGLYSTLQTEWQQFKNYAATELGQTVDCQGIVVNLGDNDGPTTAAANAFATKLPLFLTDLQTDFATRAGGKKVPIVLVRTHKNSTNLAAGADALATIRAAIDAADSVEQVSVLDIDDGELRRDSVHYGGELTYYIGREVSKLVEAISLNLSTGGATSSTSSSPGAATLVVESGTGLATANSYASETEANTYLDAHMNPAAWREASSALKAQSLRLATQFVDVHFHSRLKGDRLTSTQALEYPRANVYDERGTAIEGVPTATKNATIEMAAKFAAAPTAELMPDAEAAGVDIKTEKASVGGVSTETTYGGTKATQPVRRLVEGILRRGRLLLVGGWARR